MGENKEYLKIILWCMSMNIMRNLKLPLTPFEELNSKYFELLSKTHGSSGFNHVSSQQFNPFKNFIML